MCEGIVIQLTGEVETENNRNPLCYLNAISSDSRWGICLILAKSSMEIIELSREVRVGESSVMNN